MFVKTKEPKIIRVVSEKLNLKLVSKNVETTITQYFNEELNKIDCDCVTLPLTPANM